MTYTDAAIEVLRRVGKPTHFKDIAAQALEGNLLSHVGGTPEATMGARLLAMAVRDAERRVVAVEPGVFALVEWGVVPATEPTLDAPVVSLDGEPPYRPRERHPPLQDEMVVGGRREERRRRSDTDDEGKRKKRYPPPAEVALAWLIEHGGSATLAAVAEGLRTDDRIAEALERDLASFEKALRQENKRRAQTHRSPPFEFRDDGTITVAAESSKGERTTRKESRGRSERAASDVSVTAPDEQRKTVLRALRRRLAGLDVSALERVVVALLETQGYRDLNMARRSAKDGPLYLCRHRHGAGELRYAVRVHREGRDLGRDEVQEVRRDASHFSAQMGIVFGNAECTREARTEANTPSGTPVILYGNEALAEVLLEAGLGITRQVIEWLEYDEEFFVSMGADASSNESSDEGPNDEVPLVDLERTPAVANTQERQEGQRSRTGRDDGRGRRRRGRRRGNGSSASSADDEGSGERSEPQIDSGTSKSDDAPRSVTESANREEEGSQ